MDRMGSLLQISNYNDAKGRPFGGTVNGPGLTIHWQAGPVPALGRPSGAFVEDVIAAAVSRLNYYQASSWACEENAEAIRYLTLAQEALHERTIKRVAQGVEGTYEHHTKEDDVAPVATVSKSDIEPPNN